MTMLASLGAASASDLARELGHSHQLVVQKIPKLVSLGLIWHRDDEDDARRRIFQLTEKGVAQLARFDRCCELLRAAYEKLFAEIGDVKNLVDRTVGALDTTPLSERVTSGPTG
ncbi:MarR family winged helix-turn-helix transcriptional regulator [Sphingomonas sp. GB1N7]|uniref:MarR family winged helix-turn-helix transcriptional regulator n=1 Tax=Parasphingomonas caseinilytica TaxID=3096158 RepID=UPI002FC87338